MKKHEFRSKHSSQRLSSRPKKLSVLLQSNGYHKRFWRKAELFWKDSRALLLTRHSCCNTWPVDIYRSFKRFSVHYGISWKCFGPSRSTQRLFTASSIQTLALQPCSNWSLCWSVFRASVCYFVADCSEWTSEYLSLRSSHISCNSQNFFYASLFTLTAISVDRLLALLLGLRYRQVVSLKRTRFTIIAFWVLSAGCTTMRLFCNCHITSRYEAIVISLCLVISIFSHAKIFLTLRRHQNQVQDHVQQPNQTNQLNIARFSKVVSTALWLQFTLVVCYLPRAVSIYLLTEPNIVAISYTITLVFFNSSLNPILYWWKIDEVR